MTAIANPSFGDMLSVSDIIDTIRAEDRAVDFELGAEDRRKALIQRVKEQKAKEGVQVTDDVIAAAVERLDQQRFTFQPMKSGVNRALATGYIRRGRYFRNSAIALGVVVIGTVGYNVGYDQLVTKPRQATIARELAAKEEAARKLETDLTVRLPAELKAAVSSAVVAADRVGDTQAKANIDSRNTEALGAIAARNVQSAERAIGQISDIEIDMRNKEQVAKQLAQALAVLPSQLKAAYTSAFAVASAVSDRQAVSEIEARNTEGQGAIAARNIDGAQRAISGLAAIESRLRQVQVRQQLVAEAASFVSEQQASLVRSGGRFDDGAQTALNRRLGLVSDAADEGNAQQMREAMTSYKNLVTYAQNEAKIRIVNRRGVRAGVERDGTRWYLVVEAMVGGKAVPVEIGNKEDGIAQTVPYWGIRVSKRQYDRVLEDYQDDKIIDNDKAGIKPKGSLDVRWSLDTIDNQTITRW
jgi:hypothetical protein